MPTANGSPPAASDPPPAAGEEVRKKVREDLAKLLLLAIPTFAVQQLALLLARPLAGDPWRTAALLLPLLAASAGVLAWLLRRGGGFALRGGFLALFGLYCLAFTVAAGTDLLSGRRTLLGYGDRTPRDFLGLSRLGDWHYWLLPEAPEAQDLLVVTVPAAGRTREALRYDLATLVARAGARAKGMALDFDLAATSALDGLLCRAVIDAELQGGTVFLGYGHRVAEGLIVRRPPAPGLRSCVAAGHQGHLAGYAEGDGRVRLVPLHLAGDSRLEALSLEVASHLAGPGRELELPADGLLRFTRAKDDVRRLAYPGAGAPEGDFYPLLEGRFVFVGAAGGADRHPTPFGELPGVLVQAYAAHALRTGSWVRRLPPVWTFPAIYALCYGLVALWARGRGAATLVRSAALLSLLVVAAAAAAAAWGRTWIDVSYPLVAIWGLVGALLAFRLLRSRPRGRRGPIVGPGSRPGRIVVDVRGVERIVLDRRGRRGGRPHPSSGRP